MISKLILGGALLAAPAVDAGLSDNPDDVMVVDSALLSTYLAVEDYAVEFCGMVDGIYFAVAGGGYEAQNVAFNDGETIDVVPDNRWNMFEGFVVMMFERNTSSRLTDEARVELIDWWTTC